MLRLSSFSPRAVVQAGWAAIPRLAVLCGAGSATVLALLCLQWTVRLGTSHPVALGLVGCVSVLLALGRLLPTPTSPGLAAFGRLFAVLSLAAWCAGSPWILSGITDRLLSPEWIRPDAGGLTAMALVVATALFLGVPAVLAGWMSAMPGSDRHPGRSPAGYLMGAALGFAGGGLLLSQWLGPYAAALACLLPAIGAAAWSAWQYSPSNALAAHDAPPAAITSPAPALLARLVLASSPLAGLALGTLNEICSQLVPTTAFVAGGMLLGVLTGAGLGLILAGRRKDSSTVSLFAALVQGAAPLGIIAAFPVLVRCNLWWSASISSTGLLATIRTLLPATASLLVVAPAVCLLMRGTAGRNNATGWNVAGFLMAVAGWICAPAVIDSLGGPVLLLSLCGWCGVALAGLAAWKHSNLPVGRWSRATAALLLAVMALGSAVPGAYNPARSARTLFSTQSFTAYATGMRSELLPYLDEGRLVETVRGSRGVYTVWKYAGHQFQIRANGIPKGVVSADPSVFPRHLSETLQVVVPLTLHESPRRLMLLGLGTGEALSVGMKFPLESVVCAEVDPALVNLVKRATDDSTEPNPWDDEKLSLKSCDAILALASEEEGCDVIVSAPDAIALLHSQVCVTREFYALASQRLATDGIFCQRIQAFDFGPAPLRVIAQTMQQAFADVVMVEAGAGEYLFLGTNSPKGLYRGKLPNRLEQEHVRNVLGESGIDWSMVLNLSAVEKYGLVAFAAELPQKEPRLPSCVFTSEEVFQGERAAHTAPLIANSAASSLMPLALPREVMRWGLKIDESHREVQPLAGRLLDWIPPDSSQPILLRRLGEVKAQQDLMIRYADQYWAYRATLREQVSKRSRSQIQQASLDEPKRMHTEDRRRLAYFELLGRAVKTKTSEDIAKLSRFETPYDPLLSFFLHQESAELYRFSPEHNYAAELHHRLHSTWFSSMRDASLRNVLAALELLRDHPETELDPVQRWDDLNGLLQALERRWQARANIKPSTARQLVGDADQTLVAVDKTFTEMDRLAGEAGIPSADWQRRREVLEATLVRMVKSQKAQWLPQALRSVQQNEEAAKDAAP